MLGIQAGKQNRRNEDINGKTWMVFSRTETDGRVPSRRENTG